MEVRGICWSQPQNRIGKTLRLFSFRCFEEKKRASILLASRTASAERTRKLGLLQTLKQREVALKNELQAFADKGPSLNHLFPFPKTLILRNLQQIPLFCRRCKMKYYEMLKMRMFGLSQQVSESITRRFSILMYARFASASAISLASRESGRSEDDIKAHFEGFFFLFQCHLRLALSCSLQYVTRIWSRSKHKPTNIILFLWPKNPAIFPPTSQQVLKHQSHQPAPPSCILYCALLVLICCHRLAGQVHARLLSMTVLHCRTKSRPQETMTQSQNCALLGTQTSTHSCSEKCFVIR